MAMESPTPSYTDIIGKFALETFPKREMLNPPAELADYITQDVLHDAHVNALALASQFHVETGITLAVRTEKKLERVQAKLKHNTAFKANCDFMAFRLNCNVAYIQNMVDIVYTFCKNNYGSMFQRNYIQNDAGQYTDIVTYVYAYIPRYKYIIEFQIGHPFASYVFARDSAIRDNKDCGLIDLWDNDFYSHVKSVVLGIDIMKYDLHAELKQLYDGREIEPELVPIIDNI